MPAVLTAVETESFSGYLWPQLLDVFPGQPVIERSSMNSWDDPGFRKAIEATGCKNIIMTGLWTEVCVTWPTIEMFGAGYNIYVVDDCCGATSQAAHDALCPSRLASWLWKAGEDWATCRAGRRSRKYPAQQTRPPLARCPERECCCRPGLDWSRSVRVL